MNLVSKLPLLLACLLVLRLGNSQKSQKQNSNCYWQQHVNYIIDIDMDVNNYNYKGTQKLVYTNNSPDVLNQVFYHLYPNAFQPGSEMDIRLQNISDPDNRMVNNLGTEENPVYQSRISKLKPDEIGFINVSSLKQNGVPLYYETVGTVLEVNLERPILPGESVTFDMVFNAQVPIQIRRSGRNNKEGVALSMSQWYPKLAEYDDEGWHADPYIFREFYGAWGDFDVNITIDKNYVLGGTGYLQNPNEVGHGYENATLKEHDGDKLTWHFIAPNVHDFTWAADPEYIHDKVPVPNGPVIHFLYKSSLANEAKENWKNLQPKAVELMQYYSREIGQYPYNQYSIIQGGDGGMEYGMCTLIITNEKFSDLVGLVAHEMAHSWFQFLLASNENKHPWMDEGFTSYIEDKALNDLSLAHKANPFEAAYEKYYKFVKIGIEQPQTTNSDRYAYNEAYSVSAYAKGELFLVQLGYIIGEKNLSLTLKNYFNEFKFKHPKPLDLVRTAEKISGLELDWYLTDWTQTTNTIDYGIKNVEIKNGKTIVSLERIGLMPMPLDLVVEFNNGEKTQYYIPLREMRGVKPVDESTYVLNDWTWAYPNYNFIIDNLENTIKSISIDPKGFMADINKENNIFIYK